MSVPRLSALPPLLIALVLLPRVAFACPSCAGRDNGGVAAGLMIAGMIILPFAVAGVVTYLIRHGGFGDPE